MGYCTVGYGRVEKARWQGTVRCEAVRYCAVLCGVLRSVVLGLAGKILLLWLARFVNK